MNNQVILVDENDMPLGTADKLTAHQQGQLHRAFSIFILRRVDNHIETLLQQRHPDKYHSGSLWTNSCCSHPQPGETIIEAGQRRLQEELGFTTQLTNIGHFIYRAALDNQLQEHELDHVLIGWYAEPEPYPFNPTEISATRWMELNALEHDLQQCPNTYTAWLQQALAIVAKYFN